VRFVFKTFVCPQSSEIVPCLDNARGFSLYGRIVDFRRVTDVIYLTLVLLYLHRFPFFSFPSLCFCALFYFFSGTANLFLSLSLSSLSYILSHILTFSKGFRPPPLGPLSTMSPPSPPFFGLPVSLLAVCPSEYYISFFVGALPLLS